MAIKYKYFLATASCTKLLLVLVFVCLTALLHAQNNFTFAIKNGKMQIAVLKRISPTEIEKYTTKYKLQELNLKEALAKNFVDSITAKGWQIEINNDTLLQICKAFMAADVLTPVAQKTFFSPVLLNNTLINNTYLVNTFKKGITIPETKSHLTFVLPGFDKAKTVLLAGSFTNWKDGALPMQKIDKTWQISVPLIAGKHTYKFIVDNSWIVDPNNYENENDNEGNVNSVICKSNFSFTLNGYTSAKKVILSGSFNNWNEKNLLLRKTPTGWELPIYLKEGTYTYKFIVDGNWIEDPDNAIKFKNEFNNQNNSVLYIGEKRTFELKGFEKATSVTLLGNFNNFRDYEIELKKINNKWTVQYALGNGNYTYCFKINNQNLVNQEGVTITEPNNGSSLLIGTNYTFSLRGFVTAKKVFVTGTFNQWNTTNTPMKLVNGVWQAQTYLPQGKNAYKFIVDDKWILDPANKLWENNEYDTGNSIIWKE